MDFTVTNTSFSSVEAVSIKTYAVFDLAIKGLILFLFFQY